MKRIVALLLVLVMCLSLGACADKQDPTATTEATQESTEATQATQNEATQESTEAKQEARFRHPLTGAPWSSPGPAR